MKTIVEMMSLYFTMIIVSFGADRIDRPLGSQRSLDQPKGPILHRQALDRPEATVERRRGRQAGRRSDARDAPRIRRFDRVAFLDGIIFSNFIYSSPPLSIESAVKTDIRSFKDLFARK